MELKISSKPWNKKTPPQKVLVIRYQATGDLVITLPYLNDFKKRYPNTILHLLTRKEVSAIPRSLFLFEKVIVIEGGRNTKIQFLLTLLKIPYLWLQGYDVVMDLQNHVMSRIVRRSLMTSAWCEFDKYSAISA